MTKPKTRYELYGRQCGEGWNGLLQPLHDQLRRLGGTVVLIKEKMGGLCFFYRLPSRTSRNKKEAFARQVRKATDASFTVCETCGSPGELVNDNGLLYTACAACRGARRTFTL